MSTEYCLSCISDTSASKKVSSGNSVTKKGTDSEANTPEMWTGVLMGLLITVLLLSFLIGFLVRLHANRAHLQRYNQETSLAAVAGETGATAEMASTNDKCLDDNLGKELLESPDYYKHQNTSRGRAIPATGIQVSLSLTSPTDPDVIQLRQPAGMLLLLRDLISVNVFDKMTTVLSINK